MASMGALGALGGAADGIKQAALMDLEEARETRLIQLRGTEARATGTHNAEQSRITNTQNNDQRHEHATAENQQKQDFDLASLSKQDELNRGRDTHQSELSRGNDTHKTAQKNAELTSEQKNTEYWKGEGISSQKQWDDGKKSTLGGRPPANAQMITYLVENGMDREKATNLTMNSTTPEEMRVSMMEALIKDGRNPEDAASIAEEMVGYAFPGNAGGSTGGGANQGDIDKILQANPGKDAAWAAKYLEYLQGNK